MRASTGRNKRDGRRAARRGGRSIPALYGTLTAALVAVVTAVASVVSPATPPSIAELGPSARDRIEEARDDQGIGSGDGGHGSCAPDDVACIESQGIDPTTGPGSDSGVPPALQVAAGRRCYGDPPRQTEDPHSPPCVFEIFRGDNGGATAPGVTGTEIRVAVPICCRDLFEPIVRALIAHFNHRYEFFGRRLVPIFLESPPSDDPAQNRALADDLVELQPFAAVSWLNWATHATVHRRLASARVLSVVSNAPAFDSDALTDGFTWLVNPPIDERLRAGATLVCRALTGRAASHAGTDVQNTTSVRRFAVVVLTEQSVRPDPSPIENGLRGCDADFEVFEIPLMPSPEERENLMLNLKTNGFTTVLQVGPFRSVHLYTAASSVGYFPEWLDLGLPGAHVEDAWGGQGRAFTGDHGDHAFGFTSEVRVRPDAESPAMWALHEGGATSSAWRVDPWYEPLLVLASGIQGAGPNLTPETFAGALRTMRFPNPNPGGPPHWQQRIGFGSGDSVFHDDYAIWWWNENARSQTPQSTSGRGSFCYLARGARFTADSFPANTDTRLFSASEPCR